MQISDWIGFIGVFQILLAYFLNVTGKLTTKDLSFIMLNFVGAAMACLASVLIQYWPFVLLEGAWALIALNQLYQRRQSL